MSGLNGQAHPRTARAPRRADNTAIPGAVRHPAAAAIQVRDPHQETSQEEEAPVQGLQAPQDREDPQLPAMVARRGNAVCSPGAFEQEGREDEELTKVRVLRAYEVGQLSTVKYELHIHLKTSRNGPVIKSSIRLPNPVQSEWQIAVIAPENTPMATAAAAAGAKAVGEESLFNAIKAGNINFDKLICFEGSEAKLNAARLGPILGPKGLMPSAKTKTIVKDPVKAIFDSTGSVDYKERLGNIRLAVGQIGHSPEQLRSNIEAVVAQIKKECATISEEQPKEVHEIIISSTNSPISFSLNGKFKDEDSKTTPAMVSGVI